MKVTFDKNTAEYSGIDCMTAWNKLWGSSRCGFFTHHHTDSDRFVWRKFGDTNKIELAAYSYDQGRVPYKENDGNLLQPFTTTIFTETQYQLKMEMKIDQTVFSLSDESG